VSLTSHRRAVEPEPGASVPGTLRRRARAAGAGAILLATSLALLTVAQATPPTKFTAVVLADAPLPAGGQYRTGRGGVVELDKLTIRPGGDSGWHSHYGPLLLVVTKGTLTNYVVVRGRCTKSQLKAGKSFLEPANTPHLARNEGSTTAVFYAVNHYPKGKGGGTDANPPAACDV
jgi:quercetin dioxygenase-like cupin family protein